jgi:iron complex outermembrane receptor protein
MRCPITGILLLLTTIAAAQVNHTDTTYQLPVIEISTTRLNTFLPGIKTDKIDTALIQQRQSSSIATLLSEHTNVLVRSYGTGGLATLSMRGTLTTQSGVFWNGINLNQPNMGMTDLSIIPVAYFNGIEIQSGGGSAVGGNGLIGGQLLLNNSKPFNNPLSAMYSAGMGSFGEANTSVRVQAGNKRVAWMTAINGFVDKNRFSYKNLNGQTETLSHAVCKGIGGLNQLDVFLSPKSFLSAGIWLQSNHRQIPATMVMATNDQVQTDESIRSTLQYSYVTPIQHYQARIAFFHETLHFSSPMALIDALYKLQTINLESEYKRTFGHLTINGGLSSRFQRAKVPYYASSVEAQKGAGVFISGLYQWAGAKWITALNIRQEFEEGYKIPLCPSLSLEGKLSANLAARFNVSRNFRVPTMNDKFWEPGGNPDLEPESGWNQEMGLTYHVPLQSKKVSLQFDLNAYSMLINNLIQWVNVSTTVWSPQNVNKVWSRGIESSLIVKRQLRKASASVKMLYTYSPSTLIKTGKSDPQLIYIPLHRAQAHAELKYKTYSADIHCVVTGKRYINQDNTDELLRYTLLNASIQKSFQYHKTRFSLQLEIRNLLNVKYQVMKYYPEPGLSFMTQVNINF